MEKPNPEEDGRVSEEAVAPQSEDTENKVESESTGVAATPESSIV